MPRFGSASTSIKNQSLFVLASCGIEGSLGNAYSMHTPLLADLRTRKHVFASAPYVYHSDYYVQLQG